MYIRAAERADIPRVARLYDMARSTMAALGIDQWQNGYPNRETAVQDLENGVAKVLVKEGVIIATAAVYVGTEPTYDVIYNGSWLTDQRRSGIIHRIAVDPAARNAGAASFIMDYCVELARCAGVPSVRCDTHEGNVVMRHTLEKNGYLLRGTIFLADGQKRLAYEKLI